MKWWKQLVARVELAFRGPGQFERELAERLRAEQELRESEERYRELVENANDIIYTHDLQGRFLSANAAALHVTGYGLDELLAMTVDQLVAPEHRALAREMTRRKLAHEHFEPYELNILTKQGAICTVAVNSRLILRQGKAIGVQGIARDVTQQHAAQEALGKHAADLARSNSELEQFAYIASHDLQEPLRMVASYCQLLKRRYHNKLDKDADEFIDFAVDGARRMQVLINDLLAYSRVGRAELALSEVDIEAVVDESLLNLQAAVTERGAAVTRDPLPKVIADGRQLMQLFQNLLSNAIKFGAADAPHIHVGATQQGDSWCFSVRDDGIGIAPEHQERVFMIFKRLHGWGQFPGTGIGLAIAKKIVERHGGRIWVESTPGQGSTFYFTIPRRAARLNQEPNAPALLYQGAAI
ncbi:MAG: ATP-binding protein [Pirellulales bacterium]